jgi:DNA-binding transcriptional LysR family regulator
MRIATQFALILLASNLAAHGQHFRLVTISTGPSPRWIAVADVNHDRNPDIVVANASSNSTDSGSITVLLGDGRGGFHPAPGSPFLAGHHPKPLSDRPDSPHPAFAVLEDVVEVIKLGVR